MRRLLLPVRDSRLRGKDVREGGGKGGCDGCYGPFGIPACAGRTVVIAAHCNYRAIPLQWPQLSAALLGKEEKRLHCEL